MMENEVEMVAVEFPEELIREILLRLPVKSLLKFRCVTKSWLSLISSHQFAMAHLNISSNKSNTLIFGSSVKFLYTRSVSSVSELTSDVVYSVDDEYPVYDELLDCPFDDYMVDECRWIVGSCNGLVCLSFPFPTGDNIILWNPALMKFRMLPFSSTHFDGYSEGVSDAFGYDKVHDDYKVVEFSNSQLNVFSTRSNSWKVLTNWPGGDASRWFGQFLNGAIYWSVCRSSHWLIVSHDLASDEFVELPLPNFKDNKFVVFKVEILDGCLALCCGYNSYMDVWVMKEAWVKQFSIPFLVDMDHYVSHPLQPGPLLCFGNGKILINYGMSLRIFDSTNPQPQLLSATSIDLEEVIATTYFESLVSPDLDEDC